MVEKITMHQVRAIARTSLVLSDKTILFGKNGVGKTTVIEALHVTGWGRSFRTKQIQDLIADNSAGAAWRIDGSTNGVAWQYTTKIERGKKTTADISGYSIQNCRSVWNDFLTITHSADRQALVSGSPSTRRSLLFSSAVLGSSGRELYRKYHAVYKRRLALIKNSKKYDPEADRAWVSLLWQYGIPLREIIKQELAAILGIIKTNIPFSVDVHYIQEDPKLSLADMIEYHITQIAPVEYKAKRMIMGPQRDDIGIIFQGRNARDKASRAQQRLCSLALDSALAQHARDFYGYPTLFIADDFLSDLDDESKEIAWHILNSLSVQRVVALLGEEHAHTDWARVALQI